MKQFSKDLGNVSLAPKGKWSKEQEYERLNLVYNDCDNLSYVAKIDVPIGVEIDNREYWQPMNATGYADNNFINLTTESETGTVTAYESLEEAVATILPINRRAGATLSFYNLNADRLDRQAEFELWQFNSTDLANWENRDYWNNIYYNWNVFVGWYVGADGLKNHVKIPNVGQYAYVGTNLNDALLYQCRTNGTWTNTGIKVRNYISVVVSGNITIGENGNWFSDGKDTGIPATPAVDEQLSNIITQLQQHTTEINNLKASDANLQDQITSNDSDITNLTAKHESLSKTVQDIAVTGGASTANNVTYNNDTSGLNAENAQDAIDELQVSKIDKTSILQELGEAEDKVMSQKVVSDKLSDLSLQSSNYLIKNVTKEYSSSAILFSRGYIQLNLKANETKISLTATGENFSNSRIWFYDVDKKEIGHSYTITNKTEITVPINAFYYKIYANAVEKRNVTLSIIIEDILQDDVNQLKSDVKSILNDNFVLKGISTFDFIDTKETYVESESYINREGKLAKVSGYKSRCYNITNNLRNYIIQTPLSGNKYVVVWAAYKDNTLIKYGDTTDVSNTQYAQLYGVDFNKLYVSYAEGNNEVLVKEKLDYNKISNNRVNSDLYGGANLLLQTNEIILNKYIARQDGTIQNIVGDFAVSKYVVKGRSGTIHIQSTLKDNKYAKSYTLLDTNGIVLLSGDTTDISNKASIDLSHYPTANILYIQAKASDTNTIAIAENSYKIIDKINIINDRLLYKNKTYSENISEMQIGYKEFGYEYSCGNKVISLTTDIVGNFVGLIFGIGKKVYAGAYIEITPTKLLFKTRTSIENIILNAEHNLSITDFISVYISIDRSNNAVVKLFNGKTTYTSEKISGVLASGYGNIFIETQNKLQNITIAASSKNYNSPVWYIGDSYISTISNSRWGYHLVNTFGIDQMILGYPGSGAEPMYNIFERTLSYGFPKIAVWCIGMNNPDDNNNINKTWKTYTDKFISKCNELNITPILQLIPNVRGGSTDDTNIDGVRLHNYKNEYIKSLGYKYIDVPTLVKVDEHGNWRDGWLSSDYIHPTVVSAPILAKYIIDNTPCCFIK